MTFSTFVLGAFLNDATPDKDAVYRHHKIVAADDAVGIYAASEVDDGIECRHKQAERPEPPVCPIFTDDIEQTDDCANNFEEVHALIVLLYVLDLLDYKKFLKSINHPSHKISSRLLQEPAAVVIVQRRCATPIVNPVADPGTQTVLVIKNVVD